MKHLKSLSIFFPFYNDEKAIPQVIKKADTVAKQITNDYEIIAVNDASEDRSQQVLESLQKKYKNLRVINHAKNKGYGGALISGFTNSTKEWVFYTDGDGQYDPEELTLLLEHLHHADVVNGYKIKRADGFIRTVFGNLNNMFLHMLFHLPIRDIDCDFRLIKRSMLKKIHLSSQSGTICTELILRLQLQGARFEEVGVSHFKRLYGSSQFFRFSRVLKTIKENTVLYGTYKRNQI